MTFAEVDCRLIAMELWMPNISVEEVTAVESAVATVADNVISSTPKGEKFIIRKCEDRSLLNCSRCNLADACTIYLSKNKTLKYFKMKDRIPNFTKKYVPFEDINKELEASNAVSTGGNYGNPYVNICEGRGVENCGICSLNSVCSKVLSNNSKKT